MLTESASSARCKKTPPQVPLKGLVTGWGRKEGEVKRVNMLYCFYTHLEYQPKAHATNTMLKDHLNPRPPIIPNVALKSGRL